MRIGLFGGTFDPVHFEHVKLCRHAVKELQLDKLIIMPAGQPPHKTGKRTDPADRWNMCRLAFSDLRGCELWNYELAKTGPSYSYLTLQHLRTIYPQDELLFLIGGDSLHDFFTWKNPEVIASLCQLAVARREGESDRAALERFVRVFGKEPIFLSIRGKNLSSTEARILTLFGLPTETVMPKAVREYVARRNLYQEEAGFVERIRPFLTEKRFRHTAYTVTESLLLARRTGCDPKKAFLAAALHDVAKKLSDEELAGYGYIRDPRMPDPVVHAFAGAYLAERVFGVTDPEIVDAIRYHTTGRPGMSMLEKVLYVADCIEKTRDYEGVEVFRQAVAEDFELGFVCCLKGTMELLKKDHREQVSELTGEAYEYYRHELGDREVTANGISAPREQN